MKARQYKEDVYYAQSIIYSEVGMGQAVEEFLTKPKWRKAEKMSNGEIAVGISGGCNYDGQDCNAWFNFALNPQTKDVELFVITITYQDGRQYTMNNDELTSAFYTIMEAAYEKRGLQIPIIRLSMIHMITLEEDWISFMMNILVKLRMPCMTHIGAIKDEDERRI